MRSIRHASVLAAFALVAACSSADPGGDRLGGSSNDQTSGTNSGNNSGSTANKNNGSTSNADNGTTTTTNPTNPTTPPASVDAAKCGAENSWDACMSCCTSNNQSAFKAAADAFDACACQNPGVCQAQCANSLCAGQQPSQACDQCLQANGAQCGQVADTACAADATCKAAMDCEMAAKCDDKP